MIDNYVCLPTFPNCLEGRRLFVHFSISLMAISNLQKRVHHSFTHVNELTRSRYKITYLGEMTPHLFSLPVRLTTILPER